MRRSATTTQDSSALYQIPTRAFLVPGTEKGDWKGLPLSLRAVGKEIAPMSYDIRDYAKLGLLYKLLHVENPEKPSGQEIRKVQDELTAAVADARSGPVDLRNRLESTLARETRRASLLVRTKLE